MKKIFKLALILSLLMLSVSFAKSNSAASNNSKPQVNITFQVEGFDDVVKQIDKGKKVNQINDFHKQAGDFEQFKGIVDEWCVVEPEAQSACYTLQRLWSGPKFDTDAVIVGKVKKSFDITFVNYNGREIVTVPTKKGELPEFPESEKGKLVREKTAKYSYSFKGWAPALVEATANATYKAVYDSTLNTFKVSFFVDGELFGDVQVVEYGKDAHFPKAKPAKEGFAFVGWDVAPFALKNVKKDINVHAKFVKTYKVCYKGAEFEKCSEVIENSIVKVEKLPVDMKNTCTAWTLNGVIFPHKYVTVKKDLNFEGVCHANFVKVRFFVDGELFGDVQVVEYGKDAHFPKAKPAKEGFAFVGWDVAPLALKNLKKDLDVNAKFVKTYKVCYKGAEFEKCSEVIENSIVKVEKLPIDKKNTCTAWTLNGILFPHKYVTVKKDLNFEGVCHANFVKVRFLVDGELFGDVQVVEYGKDAHFPKAKPTKEGYAFVGWDVAPLALKNLKKDLDVNAKFVKTYKVCYKGAEFEKCSEVIENSIVKVEKLPIDKKNTCTAWTLNGILFPHKYVTVKKDLNFEGVCHANFVKVRFLVDGEEFDHAVIPFGTFALPPKKNPTKEGYRFVGWDKPFVHVVADLDVNAKFWKTFNVCYEGAGIKKCIVKDSLAFVKVPPSVSSEDSTCNGWTLDGKVVESKVLKVKGDMTFQGVCSANTHDVLFLVDGVVVDSQSVVHGAAAVKPEDPAKVGFAFTGWDTDFSVVESDLKVNALFDETATICFTAHEASICTTLVKGDTIVVPYLPVSEDPNGVTCTSWLLGDVVFEAPVVKVDSNMNFNAVCRDNSHDVLFLVDDVVVDSQSVIHGGAAEKPEDPAKDGFAFTGWDADFSVVESDLKINALFVETAQVCFVANDSADCKTVVKGDTVEVPELPGMEGSEGFTCTGWTLGGAAFEAAVVKADSNITIEALCHDNANDVKFVAFDTVLVDSQRVDYGEAAVAPADTAIPEFPGYRFNDWDKDFSSVEEDMVVNAVYDTMYTVTLKAFKIKEETPFIDTTIVAVKDTTLYNGFSKTLAMMLSFTCDEVTVNGVAADFEELLTSPFVVTGKMDIIATDCHDATHKVIYLAKEAALDTEVVAHGSAALVKVEAPEFANQRFVGWSNSEELMHVVTDLNVEAIYEDVDTVFVIVHGETFDTLVIAKGDSVDYTLKTVENTADSTFNGWIVDKEKVAAGTTIKVKGGMSIVADFGIPDAIYSKRVATFAVRSVGNQVEVVGAKKGSQLTVLDLQGRMITSKKISNSVEMVQLTTSGTYLVRVGAMSKMVTIR